MPKLSIGTGVSRISVVRINDMVRGTAGAAVIARLIVCPQKPSMRVVQPGLGNVDHRHRNASVDGNPYGASAERPAQDMGT